jgi:hypothetical protein
MLVAGPSRRFAASSPRLLRALNSEPCHFKSSVHDHMAVFAEWNLQLKPVPHGSWLLLSISSVLDRDWES